VKILSTKGNNMGFFSNLFGGGDDDYEPIARPEYYTDPAYAETQDYLKKYGMNMLEGEVPDYYKAIGETGSPEFEAMLGKTKAGISQSTAEALAKSGRARGGQLAASTAGAIGSAEAEARYADYLRSLQGKAGLFSTGIGVTEGVRGAGQTEGARRNQFNWRDYSAQVGERNYLDAKEAQEDAEFGQMIGTIASIGIGAATGGMSLGWQGALAGAADALTGGGTSFLSNLGKATTKYAKPSSVIPLTP